MQSLLILQIKPRDLLLYRKVGVRIGGSSFHITFMKLGCPASEDEGGNQVQFCKTPLCTLELQEKHILEFKISQDSHAELQVLQILSMLHIGCLL